MDVYLKILKYSLKYKKYIFISILMSILYSVLSGISIYLSIPLLKALFSEEEAPVDFQDTGIISRLMQIPKSLVNEYILSQGKLNALTIICILILVSFLLKGLVGFAHSILIQLVEKGVLKDIRNQFFYKINNLSIRYFTSSRSGNLISILTNDINTIQGSISGTFSNLIKEPLLISVYLIMGLSISWELTLISLIVFPLTILMIGKISKSLRRKSLRIQKKLSDITNLIAETIFGAKVIRALKGENYFNKLFTAESKTYYNLTMKHTILGEIAPPVSEFLFILSSTIIIWYGGNQIFVNQSLSPGEFLGFIFIMSQIAVPIKNLSSFYNNIQSSIAAGTRIFEIIDYPVEVKESLNPVTIDEFKKEISIENVSFHYSNDKMVLKNLNLKIKKSEVIALVGSSGSGKTTITDLIMRFYDVSGGKITIDGINIKDIAVKNLRTLIGLVTQEIILFNKSIRDNIIFGLPNVTEEDLINASINANAYNFIMHTEHGFDTIIGERGLKLSGGERQRISIARTLLRNPQILILDEATSSLDTESEKLVQDALDKLMHQRTSIVIAHRLSTIQHADRIVVLDKGEIVETGTHQELLVTSGIYKKLYDMQFRNQEELI
ncbi:MAG: ABC transporter ATP-binding protein/permease [Bacteroidota bacterium]|nr:ABC transporter ATP-binding protein/permease [Bacteroidota bacterium]